VLTVLFRLVHAPAGRDETAPEHYVADPEKAPGAALPTAPATAERS
jgi:hypothetical protein